MSKGKHKPKQRWSTVRVLLVGLNVMATFITLFTGLRENLIISFVTGRYDVVRSRFLSGAINTEIFEPHHFRLQDLATPLELAGYAFIKTPTRNIKSFGEDVSVCTNVNTNSAPVQILNYNDFWGNGPRRIQTYVNSISAPNCKVLNVRPQWRDACIAERQGNASLCYQYVLDNFDELQSDRRARMLVETDLGAAGVLFLRCDERPLKPFAYQADRLAHQAFWDGGDYHVTLQTSTCKTIPLTSSADLHHSLFEAFDISDSAEMLVLLPYSGWFAFIVPWVHSFVTIVLVAHGIVLALFHTRVANYLPKGVRFQGTHKWTRYCLPFMEMITKLSDNDRAIITFKGSLLTASDFWMSHWLFMWLSILDAVVNIRSTYVIYQIACSLLTVRTTLENLIFLFFGLTKITWLMCLVQTVFRLVLRVLVRCLRAVRLIGSLTREHLEWQIDGLFMFLSYRVYYVLLCGIVLVLLQVHGSPSFMVRDIPYRVPAYGGPIEIASFSGSEIACDLVTLLALLTGISFIFGFLMMWSKYRYVANNSVMRFLQQRYVLCGWDGLLAADILGLDPYLDDVLIDGHAYTQFSLGSLLQLLYLAGPSGFVHLAGDYIFHDNGFSKDPVRFAYPIQKAMDMGLFNTGKGSVGTSSLPTTATTTTEGTAAGGGTGPTSLKTIAVAHLVRAKEPSKSAPTAKRSIFERKLRVVSDGYFGKLLFIDAKQAGQISANRETGQREYEVVDALTTMSILDIKYLMGRVKKIRVQ